jgi:hypothetical protein
LPFIAGNTFNPDDSGRSGKRSGLAQELGAPRDTER